MKRFLSSAHSYLRIGYLLHLVTIVQSLLLCLLIYFWKDDWSFLKGSILSLLLSFPLFPQLDARSRFQNYKLVKDQLYSFGFQERIVKPFIKSRCQRDTVLRACIELGCAQHCKDYFKRSGYRWYHLFPDIILKKPMIIFDKVFLKTTFFVKKYHPKFDYFSMKNNGPGVPSPTRDGHVTMRRMNKKAEAK